MAILKQNKLAFIHIPKCAGTSIEKLFLEENGSPPFRSYPDVNHDILTGDLKNADEYIKKGIFKKTAYNTTLNHLKASQLNDFVDTDDLIKFSIIRDPLDRLVSAYFYEWSNKYHSDYKKRKDNSFEFYVDLVSKNDPEHMKNNGYSYLYVEPQYKYIYDSNMNLLVNKLFKFDQISSSLVEFLKEKGITGNLGCHNKSTNQQDITISPHIKRKIKNIYKIDYLLYNNLSVPINRLDLLPVHLNFLPKDNNNRKINIYKAKNVVFTGINQYYPNSLLFSQNKLYLPVNERTMSLQMSTIYEKCNNVYNIDVLKKRKNIRQSVFFFNYNTDNYFHFLYDSLPNLYSYLHLKKSGIPLKLLMYYPNSNNKFCPFVTEFLELLNIKKDDILIIDTNKTYEKVFVTTSYTHDFDSNLPPRKEVFELFNMIKENALKISISKTFGHKVYISRRTWIHNDLSNIGTNYTTRRKIMNEDQLVDILKKYNYDEVFTEKLTTVEKIHLFHNATHIIGAIGGGIANVVFSKSNSNLMALISPDFLNINKRFQFSLNAVNTTYFTDCFHHQFDQEFKMYMRVKLKEDNRLGEIVNIYENQVEISVTDGANVGWNNDLKYEKIIVDKSKIEKLDNGLNSPYIVDINKLVQFL